MSQYIADRFADFTALVGEIKAKAVTSLDRKSAVADLGYCKITLGDEYLIESAKETRRFEYTNDAMEYILRLWW